jgi:endonuclease/exonuclease/phosphatase family metal-dependent hydrolase
MPSKLISRSLCSISLTASLSANAFSVVTWNVGEISDPDSARIRNLIDFALADSPDVILFQESEQTTLGQILKSNAHRNGYKIRYERSKSDIPKGGLVTLIKGVMSSYKSSYIDLPSEMERGVLVTEFAVCGTHMKIANAHLESPDILFWRSINYRHQQVAHILKLSSDNGHWILGGDFNPVFEQDFDRLFSRDWRDSWVNLHSLDSGLTWDPEHNPLAWQQGGFILPGFRLDRILYRSNKLAVTHAQLLGTEVNKPLSDHYGLRVEFACRE